MRRLLAPPAAVASVYLAMRFEYFFRLLSGKLNGDDTWLNRAVGQPAAIAKLGEKGLKQIRVSEVAVPYKLMKLDQSRTGVRVFDALDKAIFPVPMKAAGGRESADIGDRIAFARHRTAHGQWGDMSSEGAFYGLVTAIVFYNQV
jgi:hypothetical protein